jgi:hypothetical protein
MVNQKLRIKTIWFHILIKNYWVIRRNFKQIFSWWNFFFQLLTQEIQKLFTYNSIINKMYSLATAITTDLAIGLMDIGFVFG